jgi:hypothetical protein
MVGTKWQAETTAPEKNKTAVITFIISESGFFGVLILAYLFYNATPQPGPGAHNLNLLKTGLFSLCLFASSFTIWRSEASLHKGRQRAMAGWLAATILLGGYLHHRPGIRVSGLVPKRREREFKSVRHDIFHAHRLPRLARLCRLDRAAHRARAGAGRRLQNGSFARAQGGRALLAFRRCRLGLGVFRRLPFASSPMTTAIHSLGLDMESSGSCDRRMRSGIYVVAFRDRRRIGWFAAALAVFLLTLLSPLNTLADGYLFSAHMAAAHSAVADRAGFAVVQPAAIGSRWRWGRAFSRIRFWLVRRSRRDVVLARAGAVQRGGCLASGPCAANRFAAGAGRPVLAADSRAARGRAPFAAPRDIYLFSACVACSVLGIIITFSPVTVCSIYTMPPNDHLGMLQTIRGLGFHAGARSANRRAADVGAHVFDLFELRSLAQMARWFASPKTRWRKKYNEQRNIDNSCRLGAASRTSSSAPHLFPGRIGDGNDLDFLGLDSQSWVVLLAGVGLFIAALAGWISEIRHERKQ